MKNSKKEMTIGELAVLMQKGFKDSEKKTDEKIENLAVMTQRGFIQVNEKIDGVHLELNEFKSEMNQFRDETNGKLDVIKNIMYRAHDNRLEKVEDDIRVLKTALNLNR